MKIKNIFLTVVLCAIFSNTLQATISRAMIFAKNEGIWKILLRFDPQRKIWTDFNDIGSGQGNFLAIQFINEQLGGNYYQLTTTDIKGFDQYNAGSFVHFIPVKKFFRGLDLYRNATIRGKSKDFAWIPMGDLMGSGPVTKQSVSGEQQIINVDKTIKPILEKNIVKIDEILGKFEQESTQQQQPIQQFPQQPQAPIQGQGEWENIPGAIYFYNNVPKTYYEFTNFYGSPVTIDGKVWPTTEHYYQAMKFKDTNLQDKIRAMKRPSEVFDFAKTNRGNVRSNWQSVNLDFMMKANRAKFKQNQTLKKLLLDTGNNVLVEDTAADPQKRNDIFFGAGNDYNGDNHLGQILMQVRDELQGAPEADYQAQLASYYKQKSQQLIPPLQPTQKPIQPIQLPPQIQQPIIQPQQPRIIVSDLQQQLQLLVESLYNLAQALQPSEKSSICSIQ